MMLAGLLCRYYSLFTLGMLVTFECTVVMQRMRNLREAAHAADAQTDPAGVPPWQVGPPAGGSPAPWRHCLHRQAHGR